MTTPTAFFDVAQSILDCVCDSMTTVKGQVEGYPGCPDCRAYVVAGAAADDGCCDTCGNDPLNHGQLTVGIENVFQSNNFPSASPPILPCAPAVWVAQVLVRVARCVPTVDEQGNAPSADDLSTSSLLTYTDLYAVLIALQCCVAQVAVPGKRKRRVQIASAGPTTPSGGCGAVEVRAFVEVGQVCGCPSETS